MANVSLCIYLLRLYPGIVLSMCMHDNVHIFRMVLVERSAAKAYCVGDRL